MQIRSARHEDLAAVVAVMNAVDVARLGEPDTSEDDIASGWAESTFDVSADAFVADADGVVIGYGELYEREDRTFDVDVYGHPDHDAAVIKRVLDAVLQRAEARAGDGALLGTWLPVGDSAGGLFAAAGFMPIRQFVRMRYHAEAVASEVAEPDGIGLRTFDRDRDAAAVHATLADAFAGHVRPMTRSFQRFSEQHLEHPDFDPRLWVVAEAEGDLVGAITAFNHGDIGFIRHVGVGSPHRGRGIGATLVQRAVRLLAEAGQTRVDLGVDVDDDVGAARLYEKLGFEVVQRLELVERRL